MPYTEAFGAQPAPQNPFDDEPQSPTLQHGRSAEQGLLESQAAGLGEGFWGDGDGGSIGLGDGTLGEGDGK